MNNSVVELHWSSPEEFDLSKHFTVCSSNYFISQFNWKFFQQFLRVLVFGLNHGVFKMSFDPIENLVWDLTLLCKGFENIKFVLEFFSFFVYWSDESCHVTDCVGVVSYTKDHPETGEDIFCVVVGTNVSKSDCRNCLKGPMESNKILINRIWIN